MCGQQNVRLGACVPKALNSDMCESDSRGLVIYSRFLHTFQNVWFLGMSKYDNAQYLFNNSTPSELNMFLKGENGSFFNNSTPSELNMFLKGENGSFF